jgi:DNA-binding beta-propeller fold protein YncE
LTVDNAGNVYVADTGNNLVRKITPTGIVTTLTQTLLQPPGNAFEPRLNAPGGVAVDTAGNIYVADYGNNCIRKIPAINH